MSTSTIWNQLRTLCDQIETEVAVGEAIHEPAQTAIRLKDIAEHAQRLSTLAADTARSIEAAGRG